MFALITLLLFISSAISENGEPSSSSAPPRFVLDYQWSLVNYTWPDEETYQNAIDSKSYIPEKVAIAGIKLYKDRIYTAIPKVRDGVPVSLGYISQTTSEKINPLITPFPSWDSHKPSNDCSTIQSVMSMEIDKNGIMWVIDGCRINANTKDCPSKLILIDLNHDNKIIGTFVFPEEITLAHGGFLNDIVVDNDDDGNDFAYITDHSAEDPGLVVYSRKLNKAWKFRDASMFAELNASGFAVNNLTFDGLAPIDGIALSPPLKSFDGRKRVYYCALVGFNLYSIGAEVLKDEAGSKDGLWRRNVRLEGKKQSQTDGMFVDPRGNLYYTLMPLYGVGKWNVEEPFANAEILDENPDMIWTDGFGFDHDKNELYLMTTSINRFFDSSYPLTVTDEAKFRIFKLPLSNATTS